MKFKRMIRYIFAFNLLLLAIFCLNVASAETIQDFNAKMTIEKDGSIFVSEEITYDFGQEAKHGIFREIPLTSSNGPRLYIKVVAVKDANDYAYRYSTSQEKNVLQIKIGDPDIILSGIRTFVITYRVRHAIRNFQDHDELYWNVTGNQWPVAIQHAQAEITLPDYTMSSISMACFTGVQGSKEKNCVFNRNDASVTYSTTQGLHVGEGLTVVFGMPLGFVQVAQTAPHQEKNNFVNHTRGHHFQFSWLASIFFVLFIVIKLFKRKSIKLKPVIPRELKNQPIVTEYNPPNNLSPIIIGAIVDRKVDAADITSVILDLAIRGYIKIRYHVQYRRFLSDKKDFELIRLKDGADLTEPADQLVFAFLFNFSKSTSVTLYDLMSQAASIQPYIKQIQESIGRTLSNEGYFDSALKERKSKQLKIGLFSSLAVVFIVPFISLPAGIKIFLIPVMMIAVLIFSRLLSKLTPQLTQKGLSVLRKIMGFREFLQLTEKDKLEALNAPELQPELFEKFLPYAMVLGVEEKWAKKFEGIYHVIPNWYEDASATGFNSQLLAHSLREFHGSCGQIFSASMPKTSSGLNRGFSGGGSGGGGGRSW